MLHLVCSKETLSKHLTTDFDIIKFQFSSSPSCYWRPSSRDGGPGGSYRSSSRCKPTGSGLCTIFKMQFKSFIYLFIFFIHSLRLPHNLHWLLHNLLLIPLKQHSTPLKVRSTPHNPHLPLRPALPLLPMPPPSFHLLPARHSQQLRLRSYVKILVRILPKLEELLWPFVCTITFWLTAEETSPIPWLIVTVAAY